MNMLCAIFGHELYVVKTFSPINRKVQCKRCKKFFGMEDSTQSFVKWDSDLENCCKYF